MANSVTFSNIYNLSETGEDTFRVDESYGDETWVFTNVSSPDSQDFNVNDVISFSALGNGFTINGAYLGRDATGVFVEAQGSAYYFSDSLFEDDTTLTLAPDSYPVCFVEGTLITTCRGLLAIEHLVAGDKVLGSTGWRDVKWVGHRRYGKASFLNEESRARISPVRIKAHALAENVPDRDLRTSPWHHLQIEGKLVRAGDLVNGVSVVQESHLREVSYYHVELDQFDVILAHGVYSESYADGGNRDFFENVDATSLRPEDKIRRRASRPGFDNLVLRNGAELVVIQKHVAQRADQFFSSEITLLRAA